MLNSLFGYEDYNRSDQKSTTFLLGRQKDLKIGEEQRRPQGAKRKLPKQTYSKRELNQRYSDKRKALLLEIYLRIARSSNFSAQVAHLTLGMQVGLCRESVCKNIALFIARGDLEAWVPNRIKRDRAEALIYRVPSQAPVYSAFRQTIASIGCLDSVSRNVFTGLMLYYVSNNISYITSSYSQEIGYEANARARDLRWRNVGYRRYASRPSRPLLPLYEEKNHEKETSMSLRPINVLLQPDSVAGELPASSSQIERVGQQATFNELRAQSFIAKAGIDLSMFAEPGAMERMAPPTPPRSKNQELDTLMLEWMASRANDNKLVAELKDYCPINRWSERTLEIKAKIDEIKARMPI